MPERGLYVVGEGGDFTGKSTQLRMIKEMWADRDDVLFIREPGGTPYAEELRAIILAGSHMHPIAELLAFTSGRADLWYSKIEPALAEGMTVVSDRNWYSSLAYQGAFSEEYGELIERLTRTVLPERYIHPDKAFVLQVPWEERARRKGLMLGDGATGDKIESRDLEYFRRVGEIYDETIIGRLGARAIDGFREPELIHHDVREFLAAA